LNGFAVRAALAMALAAVPRAFADEGVAALDVTVSGLRSGAGTVAIALYDEAARFDARMDPIRKAYLTIENGGARWLVEQLPPGDYALLAYHDENGNGELDFRPLGIPKEPVAVSNGANRLLGPPRFAAAKFALPAGATTHTLQLH
jgi:uncharacterized protein (DUF2141 family)